MRLLFLAACGLALTLATGRPALAVSGNAKAADSAWLSMDKCNKKAFELFPDYTREQITKRDAYVRKCLTELRLPPREAVGSR
jgi:hypothetical protein